VKSELHQTGLADGSVIAAVLLTSLLQLNILSRICLRWRGIEIMQPPTIKGYTGVDKSLVSVPGSTCKVVSGRKVGNTPADHIVDSIGDRTVLKERCSEIDNWVIGACER
jgi:hypothetical protein